MAGERPLLGAVIGIELIAGAGALLWAWLLPDAILLLLAAALVVAFHVVLMKVSWAHLSLNSVRVTNGQYPHIFRQTETACKALGIAVPEIRIFHGGGRFDVVALKQARRRGELVLTSEVASALAHTDDSRHLMMIIGRELGSLAAGHHNMWFLTDYLGELVFGFHQAWRRRCDLTADRIGMMICGDAQIAEQAVTMMYVGPRMSPGLDIDRALDEGAEVRERFSARIASFFSSRASLESRLRNLRAHSARILGDPQRVESMLHFKPEPVEMLPLMIVHGHDLASRDALVELIRNGKPFVRSIVMQLESRAAETLPEKFERLATGAKGAIAVLTPDDLVSTTVKGPAARARQNVVLEVGWFWGRVGRGSVLLLLKGDVEVPSDLSGVECHTFRESPGECERAIHLFIDWIAAGGRQSAGFRKEPEERHLSLGVG